MKVIIYFFDYKTREYNNIDSVSMGKKFLTICANGTTTIINNTTIFQYEIIHDVYKNQIE